MLHFLLPSVHLYECSVDYPGRNAVDPHTPISPLTSQALSQLDDCMMTAQLLFSKHSQERIAQQLE